MTNYLNQHKSSAPINTPGHLLANVPGALGFYPTDSVIFMTFEPCPQGMAMGPVARIDFDDAQEALPEIWETIVSPQTEVPRVLFLGLCLVFHYFSTGVVFPKIGFYFSRRAVAQALVEP
ncbi:DUF4192 family protein, partial [Corynebacterium striatum]|uniref:DUF4192 family protein n=1 Tax=Corynebacterium striatum TaxID=43770 RepID=UPI003B5A8030